MFPFPFLRDTSGYVLKRHVCIADCDGLISASSQMPTHLLTYFHSSAGQGEKIG